jgi:hypothetical protein
MSNVFSALSIALGVIALISIVKRYFDEQRSFDKQDRDDRREFLRRCYERDDEQFRRQLAREQTFRDAEKIEEVA